ncbi:MAG: DsbA family protein [Patescibacteria group bacterium]|nr:DsbA family protein [Patescibacteria group bacterium]
MKKNNLVTAGLILIAVVVMGGAVLFAGHPSGAGSAQVAAPDSAAAVTPTADHEPSIGNPNAPLTLYYWHDFQCPFCGRFDTQTLPSLVSEYVNTGKLRIVFKDFVFLGPDSETAAEMSRAVWDTASSSYNAWQEAVYNHQGAEGSGWASRTNLIALTRTIPGIDADSVSSLMDKNASAYQAAVSADYAEGQKFGVSATPGFWIDGQSFSGAQSLAFFEQIINADLAKL